MVDIASLAIQIDTSDVARAERDLDKLSSKGAKSERAAKGVGDAHDKANGKVGAMAAASRKTSAALDQGARSAGAYAGKITAMAAPLLSVAAAMAAIGKVSSVQRQFDTLNAGLITATGSAEKAKVAFAALEEFAKQTPYDLAQAVEGFTKLVNLGLTPSEKALRSYGNTASAMGKDLNQMIEAVADAATGEFERLKEFGIKAKQNGDQVSLTFQGVTKNIGNNAAEIERYLTDLGNNQFAGAMAQRMATLDGAISNLGDSWDALSRNISEAGAGDLMESAVRQAVEALDELNAQLASGQLEGQLSAISGKFAGWGGDISQTLDVVGDIFDSATGRWGALIDNNVANMTATFANFPENVRAFIQLMTVEVLNGFDKVSAYAVAFRDGIKAVFSDDTLAGVGARLNAELAQLNTLRDDSIASILAERDAALASYAEQSSAAEALRRAYDEAMANSAASLEDRLAAFKALGDAAGGAGEAVGKLGKKLKDLDATGPGDAIRDYIDELERLEDKINPAGKAAKDFAAEQAKLRAEIQRTGDPTGKWTALLAENERQMQDNTKATSEWAQWTESALERVDGAFADAWRNIGDGFSSFADSLKNAFRQMLAELAHMAVTRPIVMQIGAALGIGGGAGQAVSMMGGSGGVGVGQLLQYGQTAYSALTGVGPAALAGFQSGGIMGGLQGVGSYYGGLASGAASSIGGMFGGVQGGAGVMLDAGGNIVNYGAQATAAKVGTYAPWLSGAAGAFMGYQNSGLKGAVTGGAGGFFGAKGGAALGSAILPGIGTVIGAALGGLLGSTLGSKVFGGDWVTKSSGLAVGAKEGDFWGRNYEYMEKKGGLFGSDKDKYKYSAMDATLEKALSKRFDGVVESSQQLFEKLGFDVAEGALDGLSVKRKHIATSSKKAQEKVEERLAAWFSNVGNAAVKSINDQLSAGLEDYTFESLSELVGKLDSVNATFETLNLSLYEGSVAGAKMAEDMIAIAGGMEAFSEATAVYYDKFFSGTEKAEDAVEAVVKQFGELGQALPASREQYRALVESIDTSTESGRELVNTLIQLAGAADAAYTAFDALKADGQATVNAARQNVIAAYQREGSVLQATVSKFDAFTNSLRAFREQLSLTILASQSPTTQLSTLRREFAATASRARLGDESAMGSLPAVGANLATASLAFSASREDYLRELAGIQAATYEAEQTAGRQSSIAQQQLDALTSQLDALGLINSSVQSLAEALLALTQAETAASTAQLEFLGNLISKGFAALQPTQVISALGLGFEQLDANTDELLKPDELQSALKGKASDEQLKALGYIVDTNFDGLISATEMAAAANMSQAQAIVSGLAGVQNAIGSAITLAQAQAGLGSIAAGKDIAGQFGNLDLDKDGTLSAGEIAGTAPKPAGPSKISMSADELRDYGKSLGIANPYSADLQKVAERIAAATGLPVESVKGNGKTVAAFAKGGFHAGGLRLVGENGPELEVTGPSRIYSASQTAAMLSGGGDSARAIAGLQQAVERQSEALRSIAKHTMQTAKRVEFLERWDYDGLPTERATA